MTAYSLGTTRNGANIHSELRVRDKDTNRSGKTQYPMLWRRVDPIRLEEGSKYQHGSGLQGVMHNKRKTIKRSRAMPQIYELCLYEGYSIHVCLGSWAKRILASNVIGQYSRLVYDREAIVLIAVPLTIILIEDQA